MNTSRGGHSLPSGLTFSALFCLLFCLFKEIIFSLYITHLVDHLLENLTAEPTHKDNVTFRNNVDIFDNDKPVNEILMYLKVNV